MGYGEYDGGGSVKWHIEHTDGDSSAAPNKQRANGRDKDPADDDAVMAVWINGAKLPVFKCKGANVVVAWGDDALAQVAPTRRNP
jgi:hypothetical protein